MSFQIRVRSAVFAYGRVHVHGEYAGSIALGDRVRFSTGEVLTYIGMGHVRFRDGGSGWFPLFRGDAPKLLELAQGGEVTGVSPP